jgi:hypothetical protein
VSDESGSYEADHHAEGLRGDAIKNETSWIVTLTDAEIADIDHALSAAKATGRPVEDIGPRALPAHGAEEEARGRRDRDV